MPSRSRRAFSDSHSCIAAFLHSCIPALSWLFSGQSVRPAGRHEQVFDRPRVIAQHAALAHAETPALEDDDASRLERLGGFVHGLAAAGDTEVGALDHQLFEDLVDAPFEIA